MGRFYSVAGIDQRPLREKPNINSAFQKLFPFSVLQNFRYYSAVLSKKGKAELLEARVTRLAKRHFAALGYGRSLVALPSTTLFNLYKLLIWAHSVILLRSPSGMGMPCRMFPG